MKLTKIALGVALSAGIAGSAVANDNLLFPYVVSGGSVTTIMSVLASDADGNAANTVTNFPIRMALNSKAVDANGDINNAASCAHTDRQIASSVNDLTSFDLRGHFGAGAMFNDTVGATVADTVTDQGFLADLAAIPAVRGYVSMWTEGSQALENDLFGEAIVIDYSSGAAWGYRALSANAASATVPAGDWTGAGNVLWNVGGGSLNVPFFPVSQVQTRFFVTALNNDMEDQQSGEPGDLAVQFGGGISSTLFNRLEIGSSHNENVAVNCLGVVDMEDLLGVAANYPQYANGGFGPLTVDGGANPADAAHVIKLEYGKGSTLNGVAIGGTFNNAYALTNN